MCDGAERRGVFCIYSETRVCESVNGTLCLVIKYLIRILVKSRYQQMVPIAFAICSSANFGWLSYHYAVNSSN